VATGTAAIAAFLAVAVADVMARDRLVAADRGVIEDDVASPDVAAVGLAAGLGHAAVAAMTGGPMAFVNSAGIPSERDGAHHDTDAAGLVILTSLPLGLLLFTLEEFSTSTHPERLPLLWTSMPQAWAMPPA
jgi:hypothetical protein